MRESNITVIPAKDVASPTMEHLLRMTAYYRVSSLLEEQALSLETQIQYYTDKISSNPQWKNSGVFADTATGRNTRQRGEFKMLLANAAPVKWI